MTDQVPDELIAGDTWTWTVDVADYPATTHTATWYFENKDAAFNVVATVSGTAFVGTAVPGTTAPRIAGRYRRRLIIIRTSDSARFTPASEYGWTTVLPDPAAAGTKDWRSWARRTLDAIEATLENKATADQQSMSIGGRAISRIPLTELLAWRDKLRTEVRADESGSTGGTSRNIYVRFT